MLCHVFQVSYGQPINNLACQMCNLRPLIATHSSGASRQTFSTQNDREPPFATPFISPPPMPAGNWFIRPGGFSARFVLCFSVSRQMKENCKLLLIKRHKHKHLLPAVHTYTSTTSHTHTSVHALTHTRTLGKRK